MTSKLNSLLRAPDSDLYLHFRLATSGLSGSALILRQDISKMRHYESFRITFTIDPPEEHLENGAQSCMHTIAETHQRSPTVYRGGNS